MNIKNIAILAACAAGIAVITGCTTVPAGYVTSNVPVAPGGYTEMGTVTGTDSQAIIFGVGASLIGSSQDRAVKDALKKAPGADAIVGMAIDFEQKNFGVVHILTTRVTGTAVKRTK